ncbi:hypothetical protein DL766_001969 [Monosporascus sp. MC13-8B]|uniref:Myb-like domain-containing protein n=1 Tax=Monosporascus cannonballus TaxID=155416 RepID=A0ABY0H6H7_9PEZI|nr:hypothetical protein DL762_004870 [Monosporascus cannonballus]RYP36467.1 hypothetical protein DL766_001969 [Monosporascus sp. MC13-8B]
MPSSQPYLKRATRSTTILGGDGVGASSPPKIAQRGTRRQRRRSIESVATGDFILKSSGEYVSPEPEEDHVVELEEGLEEEPETGVPEGVEGEGPGGASNVDHAPAMTDSVEARDAQAPARMFGDSESTIERDARIRALLEIALPDFSRICGKILEQLKAIGDGMPSTTDSMRLEVLKIPYDAWRFAFTDSGIPFINLEQTSFGLLSKDDTASLAEARKAVCSGNLVSLLALIVDIRVGKRQAAPVLQDLDDAFPTLFDPTFQGRRDGIAETFDLAFRIRCRRLVDSLSAASEQPISLAARIFCDRMDEASTRARQILEDGPYKHLADVNVNEDDASREIYQKILRQLVPRLSSGDTSEIRASLDATYPQETLLSDLRSWALTSLERLTKSSPMADDKPGRPVAETRNTNASSAHDGSEPPFVGAEEGAQAGSDSGSDSESQDIHVPALKGPQGSFFDGSVTLAEVRRSERLTSERASLVPPSNQQAVKGKQKDSNLQDAIRRLDSTHVLSALDVRPPPVYPSNNRGRDSISVVQSASTSTRSGASKRLRSVDFDNNENDFEVKSSLTSRARRARIDDTGAFETSPRRAPLSGQPPASSLEPVQERHRLLQSSLPVGGGLQGHHLIALSQDVRNIKRDFNARRPRQSRVPWSAEDTDLLIKLIAKHRCSWSAIAEEGGFEVSRDQQAVRDRARNLKVLFLQGDKTLPACFDMVALGQKERNTVIRVGRNPDRRESDLDQDNNVINHIWVP